MDTFTLCFQACSFNLQGFLKREGSAGIPDVGKGSAQGHWRILPGDIWGIEYGAGCLLAANLIAKNHLQRLAWTVSRVSKVVWIVQFLCQLAADWSISADRP